MVLQNEEGGDFEVLAGTAASRITTYRKNESKGERSLDELVSWAAIHGVTVPSYIKIVPLPRDCPLSVRGISTDAKYCHFQNKTSEDRIYWSNPETPESSILIPEQGVVQVLFAATVLENDEKFLHVLAHEVHEITHLKELIEPSGMDGVSATDVYLAIEPSLSIKNLDSRAWEHADAVLEAYREKS